MRKLFGRIVLSHDEYDYSTKAMDQMTINQVKAEKDIRELQTQLAALSKAHNSCVASADEAFRAAGKRLRRLNRDVTMIIIGLAVLTIAVLILLPDKNVFE